MGIASRAKIESNMEDVSDKLALAHISEAVGRLTESQQRIEDKLDPENDAWILSPMEQRMAPILEVYDGALFAKKFVIGLSILILAIGAIGGGVIYAVNWIRHG